MRFVVEIPSEIWSTEGQVSFSQIQKSSYAHGSIDKSSTVPR
jgi:hypothetical protein